SLSRSLLAVGSSPAHTIHPNDEPSLTIQMACGQGGGMEIQELLRSLVSQAGVKTVYGEPISAEGKTVVPVAKVSCGFGGGSGKKGSDSVDEGGGGGGGFGARPLGYIEISAAGTRYVPIIDFPTLALRVAAGVCLGFLAGAAAGR